MASAWWLVAMVVVLVSATPMSSTATAASDTVVIGLAQEPDGLMFSGMQASGEIQDLLYAYMVRYNDRGQTFPKLIMKIPTVKDGDWQILPGQKMRVTYAFKRGFLA